MKTMPVRGCTWVSKGGVDSLDAGSFHPESGAFEDFPGHGREFPVFRGGELAADGEEFGGLGAGEGYEPAEDIPLAFRRGARFAHGGQEGFEHQVAGLVQALIQERAIPFHGAGPHQRREGLMDEVARADGDGDENDLAPRASGRMGGMRAKGRMRRTGRGDWGGAGEICRGHRRP